VSDFEQMWQKEEAAGQQRRADRPLSFYGKLTLEGRHVVLQKGLPGGKRDFDPEQDPEDARRMCVRLEVEPVSDRAFSNFQREFLVSSAEGNLFKDAVTAMGTSVNALQGAYVRLDVVEDPRLGTYPDRTTGVTRTRSTGLVREIFPDEATCRAASEARYGGGGSGLSGGSWAGLAGNPSSPAAPAPSAPPMNAGKPLAPEAIPGVGKGLDRATAAKFFPGVWQRASGDPDAFIKELAENKVMARHFDPASPEVLEFLTKMGHPEYAQDAGDEGAGDDGGDSPVKLEEVPF
jgi:hypothetical protein